MRPFKWLCISQSLYRGDSQLEPELAFVLLWIPVMFIYCIRNGWSIKKYVYEIYSECCQLSQLELYKGRAMLFSV